MINVTEIDINELSDYDKLKNVINSELIDDTVIERLKKYIGLNCRKVSVEYPYNERDYLSTYYIHYSQKFRDYSKKCCRLHISDSDDEYCGYITLRPTIEGTKIGKTYLVPRLLIKNDAYLALSGFKCHILGEEIIVECFPWMMQETDISICAHVSTWTILRYFGNKYKYYSDPTMGAMIEKVNGDWGRKTPSNGLTPIQISDIFKNYGFSPIVRGGKNNNEFFLNEIISYVESGLPMVGFISSKHHAVSIIGHGEINYSLLDDQQSIRRLKENGTNIILHSKLIDSLYVMEDNYFPYRKVTKELPNKDSDVDIIDTTCATMEKYPWLLLHDSKVIKYRDTDTGKENQVKHDILPYKCYENNLKHIKPTEYKKENNV